MPDYLRGVNSPNFKDKTGPRYGKLVTLEPRFNKSKAERVYTYWLCMCDCGNTREVRASDLTSGRVISCGCRHVEWMKEFGQLRRKYNRENGEAAFMYFFNGYKNSARERKMEWNLTQDDFKEIISKDCFICGIQPQERSIRGGRAARGLTIIANGIDRIDNTKGYRNDNIAPCCGICNIAKSSRSLDEFLEWINRVAKYQASLALS